MKGGSIKEELIDEFDKFNETENKDADKRNVFNEKVLAKQIKKIEKLNTMKHKLIDTRLI